MTRRAEPPRISNRPPSVQAGLADPATKDPIEALYDKGVTDGLPVVPPTRERVDRAIDASGRVGGARPGVVSMSTFAHPGRYTYCIGENEEASPWASLAVEHGFAASDDTVALLAADAPITVYDQRSRTAPHLLATVAASMAVIEHHKMTHWGDTLLVFSPEHAAIVAGDGWSKADVRHFLFERLRRPVHELVPGNNGGDGLPEHVLRKFADPEHDATPIPKFRAPEHIKILVAGGTGRPLSGAGS